MTSILLLKKLLGLVEMTSGLVNVSFSLPEWQAVKMSFLCTLLYMFISGTQQIRSRNQHNLGGNSFIVRQYAT